MAKKLEAIQIARAAAALSVVAAHAFAHPLPSMPLAARYFASFGVTLFFVISGFIMVYVTGPGRFDPGAFLKSRAVRIIPLYYFATALTASVAFVLPSVFKHTVFSWEHFLKSLLFLPAIRPGNGAIEPFLKLGWTLNYEMYFYALFASLFFLSAKARVAFIAAFLGASIYVGQAFSPRGVFVEFYTNYRLLGFIAGVVIGQWQISRRSSDQARGGLSAIFAIVGVCVSALGVIWNQSYEARLERTMIMTISSSALVLACCLAPAAFRERSRISPLLMLGDASYSIYLMHMFAVGAAVVAAQRLVGDNTLVGYVISATVGMLAGTAIGVATYFFVERPLTRFVRNATRPREAKLLARAAAE